MALPLVPILINAAIAVLTSLVTFVVTSGAAKKDAERYRKKIFLIVDRLQIRIDLLEKELKKAQAKNLELVEKLKTRERTAENDQATIGRLSRELEMARRREQAGRAELAQLTSRLNAAREQKKRWSKELEVATKIDGSVGLGVKHAASVSGLFESSTVFGRNARSFDAAIALVDAELARATQENHETEAFLRSLDRS